MKKTFTVYLDDDEQDTLSRIMQHSGFCASDVLALGLSCIYNQEVWPVRITNNLRDAINCELIKRNQTLVQWCEENGFPLGSVNGVINRLLNKEKVGWSSLSQSSRIIDAIEELTGESGLRSIHNQID